MKKYRWAGSVPLIGGMVVGPKIVVGNDPEFLVYYKPFGENEKTVQHNSLIHL